MINSITQNQFIKSLRTETGLLHAQLEQLPLSILLTSPGITLPHYINYLQLMYAIQKDAETNIFPVTENTIADIYERRKCYLIKQDLNYLDARLPDNKVSLCLTQCGNNKAFALGVMYVLEGSTLGGRFILNNIKKHLELDEANGATYFAGYKDETGEKWKSFLTALINYESQTNTASLIIQGANHAFDVIYDLVKKEVV